jgi:hypothetical protein
MVKAPSRCPGALRFRPIILLAADHSASLSKACDKTLQYRVSNGDEHDRCCRISGGSEVLSRSGHQNVRPERPCRRRAAEQRDELAAFQSIELHLRSP